MAAQNNTNRVIASEARTKQSVSLIPKLRFKEFEFQWENKKLGEVAKVITGSTPPTANREYYDGQLLFVSPADIADYRYIYETKTTITELGFKKGRKVNKGSVLFVCIGSTIGKVAQITVDSLTNQQINALEATKNYSNNFIYSLLEKNGRRIKRLAGVQAVPQINKTDFASLKYYFPQLPEQQKIATFLTAIDSKLQQLNTKKTLLEQYKKGVMQQLFSQKLRFKPDNVTASQSLRGEVARHEANSTKQTQAVSKYETEFPDWEEKTIKQTCSINPKNSKLPESFIYIDLESVDSGRLVLQNEINSIEAPSRAQRILKVNDILYQTVRPYQMNNLLFKEEGSYVASTGYAQLRVKENAMFLYQLLHTQQFVNNVLERCTGTSYPAINSNDLAKIKTLIPCNEEQQKIANYLSAIDSKIETITQQIDKTQAFKKGLLQGMFV